MREIRADVIVLGGGPAAMLATLFSMQCGADTLLVCKQSPGTSGNIVIARAGHSVPFGEDDSPEIFLEDTLTGGAYLNHPDVAAAMCEDATARIHDLHSWGVTFMAQADGSFELQPQGGHTKNRGLYPTINWGTEVARPLRAKLDREHAQILERIIAVDLLVAEGCCRGVIGFDTRSGETLLLRASATVLATGGAGQIYAETTNAGGITGDGYAMALRAGLWLTDMEFVQFYPAVIKKPKSTQVVAPTLFPLGARFFNERGENILKNVPGGGQATRDMMARAVYLEIMNGAGLDGAIRLDLKDVSLEDIRHFAPDNAELFERRGVSPHADDIYIAPKAHFFMGGLPTDGQGATAMAGLFAAGEVAAGAHGANRLSNNAFVEAYTLGARAGRAAAEAARNAPQEKDSLLQPLAARHADAIECKKCINARAAGPSREVKRICWEKAGIVRTGEKLEAAHADLEGVARRLGDCGGGRAAHLTEAFEAENMCLTARATVEAARFRTESRGAHYREDYPNQDDAVWQVNVALRLREDGSIEAVKRPVGTPIGQSAGR